jgi:hypothetical protein
MGVDENTALIDTFLNKRDCSSKIANQRAVRRIRNIDHFLNKILGKTRLDILRHLQDVRDTSIFQRPHILGR